MKNNLRSPNSKRLRSDPFSSLNVGIALIVVILIITWACNSPASEQGAVSVEETNSQSPAEANINPGGQTVDPQTQPASPVNASEISPSQSAAETAGQNTSAIAEPLLSDIRHIEGFVIISGGHFSLYGFIIRVKPITVRETMGSIIAYNCNPFITFTKAAFQLNHEFHHPTTL
jgi:hypothetical protein